ncbi:MAG: hypothetical protein R3B58_03440 [Phycisphaerales bacterium]|nr:hypothetical protein [Phycisphaerales bacterium]
MATDNDWGYQRIVDELKALGHDVILDKADVSTFDGWDRWRNLGENTGQVAELTDI